MVRWRHNVPGRKWRRPAMRMGRNGGRPARLRVLAADEAGAVRVDVDTADGAATVAEIDRALPPAPGLLIPPPPVPRGGTTLPEPHPPDADQGGPDRARERRGPHCIRSVRRGPRAGLPARRFGGVPPPSAPCFAPCQVGRFGLHAQSSHPPPQRGEGRPRSERRQPPAGRTPPTAGPGTAVRPPSRGREGRRPRDGRRTPALATAHPAGLKSGPARRVRLSQIPASRTARAKSARRR